VQFLAADLTGLVRPGLDRLEAVQAQLRSKWRAVLLARAILASIDATLDTLLIRLGKAARLDDSANPTLRVLALLFGSQPPR
jgi:hypothetical protein